MQPKGIRLNNPGNIEKGLKWQGLADIQPDERFCAFISPEYGIRAICKLLLTYSKKYRIKTLTGIVNRYAPPHENPTAAYVKNLSEWTGFGEKEVLDLTDQYVLAQIAKGITRQENGVVPWNDKTFLDGAKLAL
jgi:hypothetical protein